MNLVDCFINQIIFIILKTKLIFSLCKLNIWFQKYGDFFQNISILKISTILFKGSRGFRGSRGSRGSRETRGRRWSNYYLCSSVIININFECWNILINFQYF